MKEDEQKKKDKGKSKSKESRSAIINFFSVRYEIEKKLPLIPATGNYYDVCWFCFFWLSAAFLVKDSAFCLDRNFFNFLLFLSQIYTRATE